MPLGQKYEIVFNINFKVSSSIGATFCLHITENMDEGCHLQVYHLMLTSKRSPMK